MGKRDYRNRETKKPKKQSKKLSVADILPTSANVEVIKKRKKQRDVEVEAEEA